MKRLIEGSIRCNLGPPDGSNFNATGCGGGGAAAHWALILHPTPWQYYTPRGPGVCKKKAPPVTTTTQQGALLKAIKGPMIGDFFPIKEKPVLARLSSF